MATFKGNNTSTTTQSGSARSGSAIGGQVTGVVSGPGGSVNLTRTNTSRDQSLTTAPVTRTNTSRTVVSPTGNRSSTSTTTGRSSTPGPTTGRVGLPELGVRSGRRNRLRARGAFRGSFGSRRRRRS